MGLSPTARTIGEGAKSIIRHGQVGDDGAIRVAFSTKDLRPRIIKLAEEQNIPVVEIVKVARGVYATARRYGWMLEECYVEAMYALDEIAQDPT
jgi:type III secretory pathway component EscU